MQGLAWILMLVGGILGVIASIVVLIINRINVNSGVEGRGGESFDTVQAIFSLILGVLFAVQGYLGLNGEISGTAGEAIGVGVFIVGVALVAYNLRRRRYAVRRSRLAEAQG